MLERYRSTLQAEAGSTARPLGLSLLLRGLCPATPAPFWSGHMDSPASLLIAYPLLSRVLRGRDWIQLHLTPRDQHCLALSHKPRRVLCGLHSLEQGSWNNVLGAAQTCKPQPTLALSLGISVQNSPEESGWLRRCSQPNPGPIRYVCTGT